MGVSFLNYQWTLCRDKYIVAAHPKMPIGFACIDKSLYIVFHAAKVLHSCPHAALWEVARDNIIAVHNLKNHLVYKDNYNNVGLTPFLR